MLHYCGYCGEERGKVDLRKHGSAKNLALLILLKMSPKLLLMDENTGELLLPNVLYTDNNDDDEDDFNLREVGLWHE